MQSTISISPVGWVKQDVVQGPALVSSCTSFAKAFVLFSSFWILVSPSIINALYRDSPGAPTPSGASNGTEHSTVTSESDTVTSASGGHPQGNGVASDEEDGRGGEHTSGVPNGVLEGEGAGAKAEAPTSLLWLLFFKAQVRRCSDTTGNQCTAHQADE